MIFPWACDNSVAADMRSRIRKPHADARRLKPVLRRTLEAGHPNVGWTKQGMDGVEIHVDRGTGTFCFLAIDTVPDYLDTAPLPAPGTSAVWKYKAVYRFKDEQVGQWSDVASVSVMR